MTLHAASGRWRLGLLLALTTAACWATLPVALKTLLRQLDVYTLTWFRFVFAALALGGWLAWRGRWSALRVLPTRQRWILFAAGLLLIGNYLFYLLGLSHTSPANAQLLIQLAPLLMALGGVLIFRESFQLGQWLGLAAVAMGLWLFFAEQRAAAPVPGDYQWGAVLILLAAWVWAGYALLQKQLLLRLESPLILACIYVLASLLLWPLAKPGQLLALDAAGVLLLLYCAANTLVAYGAFAEALAHWQASRVSAILALTPLLTWLTVEVLHRWMPQTVNAERIGWLGAAGAVLVVIGSALTSLLGQRR